MNQVWGRRQDSNPHRLFTGEACDPSHRGTSKSGAEGGDCTRVSNMASSRSPIELHPRRKILTMAHRPQRLPFLRSLKPRATEMNSATLPWHASLKTCYRVRLAIGRFLRSGKKKPSRACTLEGWWFHPLKPVPRVPASQFRRLYRYFHGYRRTAARTMTTRYRPTGAPLRVAP